MAKHKVSVTLSPERLRRAKAITGSQNVSELLDDALGALIERELELRWLAGHDTASGDPELPGEVTVDLTDVPWDSS
ncbi:MAG: type II toxin-antitoxin system CcdA family antitoxin [Geodermatophilaceae bacterium]